MKETADKFQASTLGLTRLTGLDFGPGDAHFNQLDVLAAAQKKFEQTSKNYVTQCGGEILPIADVDLKLLFGRYFAGEPHLA